MLAVCVCGAVNTPEGNLYSDKSQENSCEPTLQVHTLYPVLSSRVGLGHTQYSLFEFF
jgi:hypothetical protein